MNIQIKWKRNLSGSSLLQLGIKSLRLLIDLSLDIGSCGGVAAGNKSLDGGIELLIAFLQCSEVLD